TRRCPVRAARQYALGCSIRIAEDHEFIMSKMAGGNDAVEKIYPIMELVSYLQVLVVFGRVIRFERAISQDQIAIVAEGDQFGDELRVIQFIEGGVNLAILLSGFSQQSQNFR